MYCALACSGEEKENEKINLYLVVAISLILLSSGVSAARVINVAVPTDPDSFDPTRTVAAATSEIAFNIYEGLVKASPSGRLSRPWQRLGLLMRKYDLHLLPAGSLLPQWFTGDCGRRG